MTTDNNHIKTSRISLDEYFMKICHTVAERATCRHREQGAIIVKNKHIIATGYNGAPSGIKDCLERGFCSKSEGLGCLAEGLHGESNAIIMASNEGISVKGATMYCVYSPCKSCCGMIKASGIVEVVYEQLYSNYIDGPSYLIQLGIVVQQRSKGGK